MHVLYEAFASQHHHPRGKISVFAITLYGKHFPRLFLSKYMMFYYNYNFLSLETK